MELTSQQLLDHLYYKKLPRIYVIEDHRQNNRPLYRYLQALIEGGYADALRDIEDVTKLVDPEQCPAEFFPHLYESFGFTYFPDIPIAYQRKILANVGELRKRRGTYACVRYLVRVLTGIDVNLTMTHYVGGKLLTITLIADTLKVVTGLENSFAVVTEFIKFFVPYNLDVLVNSEVRVQSMTTQRKRYLTMTQGRRYDLVKIQN